jgi:hypothetical protein
MLQPAATRGTTALKRSHLFWKTGNERFFELSTLSKMPKGNIENLVGRFAFKEGKHFMGCGCLDAFCDF